MWNIASFLDKMVDCKSNLDNCKSMCCKALVLLDRNITQDKIKYYELRNCKVERITREQYRIIIPSVCSALGDDGLCTIHETKPNVCKRFNEKNTNGYWIPPNCLLK